MTVEEITDVSTKRAPMMDEYSDISVEITDGVATMRLAPSGDEQYARHGGKVPQYFPKHKQIGQCLHQLRNDENVDVIVLTGQGDHFFVPPSTSPGGGRGHAPVGDWALYLGLTQTLQALIEIEKPVVARVNGDAIGFGSSLMFACDLIVAVKDALIADHHLGMGEISYGRADVGVVPGDGGAVFVPLHLPPAAAKEYLLLGKQYRAAELAERGIINKAVPRSELDVAVDEYTRRLKLRTAYALRWGKKVINRRIQSNFNLTFDAAWGYEMAGFYMNKADQ